MFLGNNNDLSDSSEAEPVQKQLEKQKKQTAPKEKAKPKKTNPPKEKKNPPNPKEKNPPEKKNPPKEKNPSEQSEKNLPEEKNPPEKTNPPMEKKNPSKGMKRPAAADENENEHQDQHEDEKRGYKLRPYRKTQAMAISRTSGGQVLQVKAKGASFEQNTEIAEVLISFLRDGTPEEEVVSMKANMCSDLESKIAGK